MTVGISLLIAGATGVTVGAAADSRDAPANGAAADAAAVIATSATSGSLGQSLLSDESNRAGIVSPGEPEDAPAEGERRTVLPGLEVVIGELRVATDPSGVQATSLPLDVTNTGKATRSFDITVHAVDSQGELITSDVGTTANLRPGQTAAVRVMEIVDNALAEQLRTATFEIADAFAY